MRTLTRAAAMLAGAATLSLGLVAPANAALGDPPTLTIADTTFTAGSWGDGVEFTVTDVPEEATEVTLSVGSMGQNGGGLVADPVTAIEQGDGSYTGTVTPPATSAPVAPDADGYPVYTAHASYTYLDGEGEEQFASASVELTITEGVSVSGPSEATVGQLAAGVTLQFEGFEANEAVSGDIEFYNPDAGGYESIGDFSATLGADGSGEGILTITGASVGDQFRVVVNGEAGTVIYYVTVIDGDAGDDEADDENDADDGAEAPRRPERVDTGA